MIGINSNFSISNLDPRMFDYKAQQAKLKEALKKDYDGTIADFTGKNATTATVKTLKKESADFLKNYTDDMTAMKKSAESLTGANLDKLLGDGGEANIKNVVDAAQKMVDAYNKSLTTLNKNADRGPGVTRQIGRMATSPAAEKAMALAGLTVNKDATLSLDKEKLTKALSGSETERSFTADILKDVARGVKSDAAAALDTAPGALISNDLANIREQQSQTASTIRDLASGNSFNMMALYSRSGSVNMMNMGAVGLLMNTFA